MRRKITLDFLRDYFQKHSCILLEEHYINAKTKMKYQCSCGNISFISWDNFKKGKRCKDCGIKKFSHSKKLSHKLVKQQFDNNGYELISDSYDGESSPLLYRCTCGNISEITYAAFREKIKTGSLGCHKCGNRKYTIETVKRIFKQNGCQLLSTVYENCHKPLDYVCECGNRTRISLSSLVSGQRCMKCTGTPKHEYQYVKSVIESKGFTLISDSYESANSPLEYICTCGRRAISTFSNIKKNTGCKECKGERLRRENHPLWNPNLTDEDRLNKRDYYAYYKWRLSVYKRDDFTCKKCNSSNHDIVAHHIYNYATHIDKRIDLDNGITLCQSCHKKFHSKYGYRNNNQNQLNEFLMTV